MFSNYIQKENLASEFIKSYNVRPAAALLKWLEGLASSLHKTIANSK